MTSVNSLSGGKTSSYLAAHYPADINIFALVCSDEHNINASAKSRGVLTKTHIDYVNRRLERFIPIYGEFLGTTEDPLIIETMMNLEQHLGSEITWVRGASWETMMNQKKAIPNMFMRFCTTGLKVKPIFDYLYDRTEFPVKMRIGFRYDEKERATNFNESFKVVSHQEQRKDLTINRWKSVHWRIGEFPLIDKPTLHGHILDYWKQYDVPFAEDSNCLNCFWKQPQQLRKNFESHPSIMTWARIQEDLRERTFRKEQSYTQIGNLGLQLDFNYGTGSGCQAGFCTD